MSKMSNLDILLSGLIEHGEAILEVAKENEKHVFGRAYCSP